MARMVTTLLLLSSSSGKVSSSVRARGGNHVQPGATELLVKYPSTLRPFTSARVPAVIHQNGDLRAFGVTSSDVTL